MSQYFFDRSVKWEFLFGVQEHPAGDMTTVSVVPRKVTVKIGDAENWCRNAEIKID